MKKIYQNRIFLENIKGLNQNQIMSIIHGHGRLVCALISATFLRVDLLLSSVAVHPGILLFGLQLHLPEVAKHSKHTLITKYR